MKNPQREAYIRAAFAKAAEDLIALDGSRAGSVTIHFSSGGTVLKDEWRFLGRLLLPAQHGAAPAESDT